MTSTAYASTIIFVLINLLPGLIDLRCIVQLPEVMHIDILFYKSSLFMEYYSF